MATVKTTTGLNTNKISAMKKALEDYIAVVKKQIQVTASTAAIEKAIKGTESEATLKKLNSSIDAAMTEYITKLKEYETVLDTMKTNYANQDTNNTSFTSVTNNLK